MIKAVESGDLIFGQQLNVKQHLGAIRKILKKLDRFIRILFCPCLSTNSSWIKCQEKFYE